MGQESILSLSGENYRDKFDYNISEMAKKWYLHNHFKVGSKINGLELLHYQMFDFLCNDNCELQKYINDKIVGNLDTQRKLIKLHIPIENLELVQNITNINNITNVINEPYQWQSVTW